MAMGQGRHRGDAATAAGGEKALPWPFNLEGGVQIVEMPPAASDL